MQTSTTNPTKLIFRAICSTSSQNIRFLSNQPKYAPLILINPKLTKKNNNKCWVGEKWATPTHSDWLPELHSAVMELQAPSLPPAFGVACVATKLSGIRFWGGRQGIGWVGSHKNPYCTELMNSSDTHGEKYIYIKHATDGSLQSHTILTYVHMYVCRQHSGRWGAAFGSLGLMHSSLAAS